MRIELCRWRDFQHYKRRHAPWVRVYVRLLNDPQYRHIPHAARCLLIDLWMLAAESMEGQVVTTIPDLAWACREPESSVATSLLHLASIQDSEGHPKWLTVDDTNELERFASMLDKTTRVGGAPETETETEQRYRVKKVSEGKGVVGTWVTPFLEAWVAECGGTAPAIGRVTKALAPLYKKYGTAEVVSHLRFYLHGSNGKSSIEHFAQTYGKWDPAGEQSGIGHDDSDFFTADSP